MDAVVQKSSGWLFNKRGSFQKKFRKEIWKPAVDHQYFEMEKVVFNQSSDYRLSQKVACLSVPIQLWYAWSKNRNNKYINFIQNTSKRDLNEHETLKTDMWHEESGLFSIKEAS